MKRVVAIQNDPVVAKQTLQNGSKWHQGKLPLWTTSERKRSVVLIVKTFVFLTRWISGHVHFVRS